MNADGIDSTSMASNVVGMLKSPNGVMKVSVMLEGPDRPVDVGIFILEAATEVGEVEDRSCS